MKMVEYLFYIHEHDFGIEEDRAGDEDDFG